MYLIRKCKNTSFVESDIGSSIQVNMFFIGSNCVFKPEAISENEDIDLTLDFEEKAKFSYLFLHSFCDR